jgi:hypothetical protein
VLSSPVLLFWTEVGRAAAGESGFSGSCPHVKMALSPSYRIDNVYRDSGASTRTRATWDGEAAAWRAR